MANPLEGILERSISEIFGFGIGTALGNALQPESVQLAQEAWTFNPVLVLNPDILARLITQERLARDKAEADAKQTGLNDERLEQLRLSQLSPPSTGEILELLRRRELSEDAATAALERSGYDERYIKEYLSLARILLSPADLAMARQQSFISVDEHYARSLLQGVNNADAELLYKMSGLPYGPQEALELWRRGKITEDRARQALREGHLKNDFIDDYLNFRYQPLSASIAAEALIRQRIPQAKAIAIAEENGLNADDFLTWSNMLGRPIATGEALTLARRGEFNFEQFTEAVARSDVRTEYAPDIWKLRRTIPPLFQLVRLHDGGKIDDQLFGKLLGDLGYDKDLVAALAHAGKTAQTAKTHHLTATQIDEIYQSGLEDEAWAMAQLKALGYDEDSARWHLSILWAQMLTQAKQASIRRIRSLYVAWKIDATQMQNDLDATGITATAKEAFIESWNHERAENQPTLTTADVRAAYKWGRFDYPTAFARLSALGHTDDDAVTLLWVTHHGDPRPTG